MVQLENLSELAGRDLTFGGIVTSVRDTQTRNGKPCGFVKMEDYSGAGELALFGDEWARLKGYFNEGYSLFITARVEQRRWKEGMYDMNIGRVEFLSDVKDQKVKSITVSIRLDALTEPDAIELNSIIKKSKGNTDVYFNVVDIRQQQNLMLQSKLHRLTVDKELIDFLDSTPAFDYKIN